ncbi:hypothetical protein H5P28_11515 [Ruficoccus amylovorans]|uniref:Phage integrase family protein n=1 Tax=Ruficoccus amylovorans TaxID=1804625 RepID=A0A842HE83_9BACT|nr:site-specific integrase [Ruficoccus amylovorans]MBC2594885.1 hypothetical protein [Ruficoccus amylovorans]
MDGETDFRTPKFGLRVYLQSYTYKGQKKFSPNWYYMVNMGRQRKPFVVGTGLTRKPNEKPRDGLYSDQRAAATRAEQIYVFVQDKNRTLADVVNHFYAGDRKDEQVVKARPKYATIEEVLEAFGKKHRRWGVSEYTAKGYRTSLLGFLRRGMAAVSGKKFENLSGHKIDYTEQFKLPVNKLTLAMVHAVQDQFIEEAEDEEELNSKKTTANTYLRSVQSVFGETPWEYYQQIGLTLPERAEWDFLKAKQMRVNRFYEMLPIADIEKIVRGAEALKKTDLNAWRALILACHFGLRRKEIAHAQWPWFQVGDEIRFRLTLDRKFIPKWAHAREVVIKRHVYQWLHEVRTEADGYIIEGAVTERLDGDENPNGEVFGRLIEWLRSIGIDRRKPIHELRKIWTQSKIPIDGMLAAQKQGGWKDLDTLNKHYADQEMPKSLLWWWETGDEHAKSRENKEEVGNGGAA